ncbi:phospholipase D-like domain-containing protein [Neobacillus sp. NPDC058068]|uniref:phospholipase D-like domain-containing protein n=1 Tax=Neobacillus sp. NPDC058068 TaxID=3346325 RepID=UPI0036DF7561
MSNLDVKIVSFVDAFMSKNTGTIEDFISILESYGEQVIDNIQLLVHQLDYPYDLAYLCFDILNVARSQSITAINLALSAKVAIGMFKRRKKTEPVVLPVWTGPSFDESPIVHRTYETVQRLFQTAQYEILIVGYTFSLESEYLKVIFDEVIAAARRGCRIEIIYHKNEQNLDRILNLWPNDLFKPSLYSWKGNENEWASLHSKLIMVDQRKTLITSANFTFHGFRKNIETGVLVENHELSQIMWRQFRSLIQNEAMVKYKLS